MVINTYSELTLLKFLKEGIRQGSAIYTGGKVISASLDQSRSKSGVKYNNLVRLRKRIS